MEKLKDIKISRIDDDDSSTKISVDYWPIAIALLVIAFWGEPDLIDALIYFLMKCN